MEPARPLSRRVSGGAVDESDGAGVQFCGDVGTGARRPSRAEPAHRFCTALRAQAAEDGRRRRGRRNGEWVRGAGAMGNVAEMRVIVGDKDRETERAEELRILEALLFAAEGPLDEKVLAKRLPAGVDVRALLTQLQKEYEPRGVNLIRVAGKWTLRTASDLAWLLTHEATVTRKLSRAAIETLAIVAYHQPVTRAEIEDIRGVTTSKGTLDVLLETGWIRLRGRRKAPGRPVTYGTNEAFLSHFGLEALNDLPGLDELKGAGLIEPSLPAGFSVPVPSDDPALRDDEDPLEPRDSGGRKADSPCGRWALRACLFLPPLAPRFWRNRHVAAGPRWRCRCG